MFDTLRDAAKIGMGAIWLSRENIKKFTDELIEMGRVSKEEGDRLFNEIGDSQDEYKSKLNELVDNAVQKALDTSGLARKSEVEELREKVAQLESKLKDK
jgi:polyhydroxyalkanoate synthesis regulator phasin